jgi:hypothetical protein
MDIVDEGSPEHSIRSSWAEEDRWTTRQFHRVSSLSSERLSACLTVGGFILVLASQWFPWVRLSVSRHGDDDSLSDIHSLDMISNGGLLQAPYYLLWLVVFAAAGALAFTPAARRRVVFGIGAAALASQSLIVMPLLHHPLSLLNAGLGSVPVHGVKVVHTAGSYCLVVAFGVLAAALIVGVGGRVLPGRTERAPASAAHHPMHEALATSAAILDSSADIVVDWSPNRAVVTSEVLDHHVEPSAEPDHSMYRRPLPRVEAAELPR